ncbi:MULTISPECIES: two-partner secretion domain-containing protein [unclassified Tolypothrix]|uniref:two-partner secretion domain-containing protein n=1 Tax=unclassified Tolypothrix TaxID=2649714 RepID=UPI0005EABC05|nr:MULTISPECIES: S-layer family protein [unclassified Tolypothrix]BAY89339.1 filamentous hemagglutinin family outer membrane protein [Microchaete diplosiphon NIES-3275]EKE97689.1 protein, filamentous hemagglutinin family [Tolypothrix sp. PCC 7601]MBE9084055.1 S-layer family protein [Tolypothrix sp. LEGE 11397]UYD23618.1 S-layer family protein [Tolypothrix sp. PCC 7712]UYD34155.1 S-layer family protein [Tolypothrix sp. PCC 7601]
MKFTFVGFGILSAISVSAVCNNSVYAQITPDGTLGTVVNGSSNYNITEGTRVGKNLFHSFSQFSIPTGSSASFDNPTDIQNIFSRVSGGNISNIDGLISAQGNANLFLLNPSGIIFGPNASLNIGGSFIATTANSIKFADGAEFSAVPSAGKPLLTMSVPVGLQMGQNSGGITVEDLGHRITGGVLTALDRTQNLTGLQVNAGNTLALIGNEVNFSGGIVATNGGGHLEVGSVQQGEVRLNPSMTGWKGDYSQVEKYNNIDLGQQSLVDASGSNSSIQIQGKNINLSAGSAVVLQNLGEQSQGITIRATGSLNLTGNTSDQKLGSMILIDNLGTGLPGDILIEANQLSLQDGGGIWNRPFNTADSGNITVNVKGLIDLNGFVRANPSIPTSIRTNTSRSSNAGDVFVSTSNLRIRNGSVISSSTLGSGQAGSVRVIATEQIEILGNNPISQVPSSIASSTRSTGNANSNLVNTSRLIIRDGGFVGSNTLGQGSAGSVTINASDFIEVSGRALGSITSSRILSSAEIIDAANRAIFGQQDISTGDAGALTINTPSLRVTDGALITVKSDGTGKAGDLQINAQAIFLNNQGSISASTASGNGGNIHLNLQNYLLMRHGSFVSATSKGAGNGGNVSINSPAIAGLENSDIIANAVQGRGGNININTQAIFGLQGSNQLTSASDITASSQFGVNGTVNINNFGVDPNSGLVELPVNFTDPSQQIASGCSNNTGSSFIATGRGGTPQSPNQDVRSDRTWSDVRDISAFHTTKPAQAQIPKSPATLVQATSWRRNAQGKIELISDKSSVNLQPSLTCAAVHKS